jgi:hypothetical protein
MVRAKFQCASIKRTKFYDGIGSVIELTPVTSGSEETNNFINGLHRAGLNLVRLMMKQPSSLKSAKSITSISRLHPNLIVLLTKKIKQVSRLFYEKKLVLAPFYLKK